MPNTVSTVVFVRNRQPTLRVQARLVEATSSLTEGDLAAVERIDLIRCGQLANGGVSTGQSSTPGSRSNFFSRDLFRTGRSSAS